MQAAEMVSSQRFAPPFGHRSRRREWNGLRRQSLDPHRCRARPGAVIGHAPLLQRATPRSRPDSTIFFVGAAMATLRSRFFGRLALGAAIGSAIPVIANVALAQAPDGADRTPTTPSTLIHRIADEGGGAGPGGFADLAARVGPAVIGIKT